jgi:hypothetical protein
MNNQHNVCGLCKEIPSQHRCREPIRKGGIVVDGLRVCGEYICAPCSETLGNEEGVYRCVVHCPGGDELEEDMDRNKKKEAEVDKDKKNKPNKVTAKGVKGGNRTAEYSAKDLLVLAQSFIRVSENAIEGASQKRNKFWDDVAVAYNKLKEQQEAYDQRQKRKEKYNQVRLRGEFLSDDDDDVEFVMCVRTASSLQQKWSKSLQPLVTKFISVTNRHPKRSGEGMFQHFLFILFNF